MTAVGGVPDRLQEVLRAQDEKLMACVHCGFCLPACPTYRRLGDEADSPRGRLHLMKAVVEGRLDPAADAFQLHIDRCLGCRACEPVCPSGVPYGQLLELAREVGRDAGGGDALGGALMGVMGRRALAAPALALGRWVRATGLPAAAVRALPDWHALARLRLGLAMLAASAPWGGLRASGGGGVGAEAAAAYPSRGVEARPRVGILSGCVQSGLFGRVNRATRRVLEANGYAVVEVSGQGCCGALHAHGGNLDDARALARVNVEAFERAGVDRIALNAAGCGAAMREYGHLLVGSPAAERAADLAGRVRDVTELLAETGPRVGAPISLSVAYDPPCHLLHAQGVDAAPRRVLESIPGVTLVPLRNADECCGGAGVYGITHPDLGGRIGGDKVEAIRESGADVVATGNPGCMMQIGAGLRLAGVGVGVLHPVELLDESYRRAGYYDT